MERDGMISSKRGTGYFFTEDLDMTEKIRRDLTLDSLRRFLDEMRALGLKEREILDELESYMKGEKPSESDS
jgi:DNA-binding transcriptional regulator YhcF (GntR family)